MRYAGWLLLLCLVLAGYARAGDARVEETPLGGLPFAIGVTLSEPVVSPDWQHLAFSCRMDDRGWVWYDGQQGKEYTEVTGLCFSRDGKHLVYIAYANDLFSLVIDGKEGPWYKCSAESGNRLQIPFCVDETHYAYPVRIDGKEHVIIDGVPGPAFDTIRNGPNELCWGGIIVSPDGKHVGYIAEQDGKLCVVIDGKPGPRYDRIDIRLLMRSPGAGFEEYALRMYPLFFPDSSGYAYTAQMDRFLTVIVNGVEQQYPVSPAAGLLGPFVAPAGAHVAYFDDTEFQEGELNLVVDGRSYLTIKKDDPCYGKLQQPLYSPDGTRFAFVHHLTAQGKACQRLLVDGQFGPSYDDIPDVKFSADSRHVYYLARRGEKTWLVKDGKATPLAHRAYALEISPDGQRIALACYAPRDERAGYLVLDGKQSPLLPGGLIIRMHFSADSARLFSIQLTQGNRGKAMMRFIRDLSPDRWYEGIAEDAPRQAVLLDDSTDFLYIAQYMHHDGGRRWYPVLHGREMGDGYEQIFTAAYAKPHVAVSALVGDKRCIELDGDIYQVYDVHPAEKERTINTLIFAAPKLENMLGFDAQGVLHAYGVREGTIYHATITPQAEPR